VWSIGIENTSQDAVSVEAWAQRDDPVLGLPRYGRESRFDDPHYVHHLAPSGRLNERDDLDEPGAIIRRSGAVNGIATGHQPVVVGGFRRHDGRPSAYSGRAHGSARHPDAAAVADESWNRRGVIAAGVRSGSAFAMDGTSVAAAQVARLIVAQRALQAASSAASTGLSHGRMAVQEEARTQEGQSPPQWNPGDVDSTRFGVGRIELPSIVPRGRCKSK
jgi:hypothetical protein